MEVKISLLDPTGGIVKSENINIPFFDKVNPQLKNENGVRYEPMCQNRCLLEIGNYQYWIRYDGEIILIK